LPQWGNQPLRVFHGTDDDSLRRGSGVSSLPSAYSPIAFVPNLSLCRPFTDFGQGFYVTTRLHQAKQWANARVRRRGGRTTLTAVVIQFLLDRDWLASLDTLAFVRPTREYWALVTDCRHRFPPHQRLLPHPAPYDVVYGPVSLWPQLLVIGDCDQISFHTRRAVSGFPQPTIAATGNRPDGGDLIF
jgi:Protein of unknown function (DUF3990)